MTVLPMFPLGTVLLPGALLPLHVFEPRYRQLVADCLAGGGEHWSVPTGDEPTVAAPPEFGVALIERGSEVGGGDVRAMIGTAARMIDVRATPDGRYAVVAVGVRRLRVHTWQPDDPYPLADVDDWPDEMPDDPRLAARITALRARLDDVSELARRLGDAGVGRIDAPISDDPVLATYHLARLAPIGPADRYRALGAAGPIERLDLLAQSLDDVEAALRFRLG